MAIQFTTDQVLSTAPDSSSAKAGKKLAQTRYWQDTGYNESAIWGLCQGSALYKVSVELASLTSKCSCPSRKFPCKHAIGLLLLAATTPDAIASTDAPDWVASWLKTRAASQKRRETIQAAKESGAEPSEAQIKTAQKRLAQVTKGIETMDLWLEDLVRNGLASVETQPATFWEDQARQMVDAQAPGLAARIQRMAEITNASTNWPEKLLGQLGQLALLSQAFKNIERLDANLQEDVRQLIGWSLQEPEVLAKGERVSDEWLFLGQTIQQRASGQFIQRTWLLGNTTKRAALVLQFSIAGTPYKEVHPIGARQQAELVFWPGALAQRALIATRDVSTTPIQDALPGHETIEEFFQSIVKERASQPWRDRFLCSFKAITPFYDTLSGQWWLRDRDGQGLRMTRREHWKILALAGGQAVDLAGEWDGDEVTPLSIVADRTFYTL